VIALLLVLIVIVAAAYWFVRRSDRPPIASDLRRADDAESADMPSSDDVQERIGEAFGETRPPGT
jgi:hypothetical protein